MSTGIKAQWEQVREQWRSSLRVRIGGYGVLAIALVALLLTALDGVDAGRARVQELDAELARQRALTTEKRWPDRVKEAEQFGAALLALAWNEPDLGLNQAAVQDWLRNMTARLGLKTREFVLARVEDPKIEATLPPGYVLLRARVTVEVQRTALMTFLAECARNERVLVVERLVMRPGNPVPVAEIELRALARRGEVKS